MNHKSLLLTRASGLVAAVGAVLVAVALAPGLDAPPAGPAALELVGPTTWKNHE